jgi:hypothetical protein
VQGFLSKEFAVDDTVLSDISSASFDSITVAVADETVLHPTRVKKMIETMYNLIYITYIPTKQTPFKPFYGYLKRGLFLSIISSLPNILC